MIDEMLSGSFYPRGDQRHTLHLERVLSGPEFRKLACGCPADDASMAGLVDAYRSACDELTEESAHLREPLAIGIHDHDEHLDLVRTTFLPLVGHLETRWIVIDGVTEQLERTCVTAERYGLHFGAGIRALPDDDEIVGTLHFCSDRLDEPFLVNREFEALMKSRETYPVPAASERRDYLTIVDHDSDNRIVRQYFPYTGAVVTDPDFEAVMKIEPEGLVDADPTLLPPLFRTLLERLFGGGDE